MKAVLVVNSQAGGLQGKDAPSLGALRDRFREAGLEVTLRPVAGAEIAESLRDVIAGRPELVYVAGGDGTLSTAAGLLAGTGTALGAVPLGTLNHFARDLGISVAVREAVRDLAGGHVTAVDVGEVNGRVFINNCSIGSYPEAVRKRDALRRANGAGKWTAMVIASIGVFRRLRRLRLRVEASNLKLELRTPFLLVANNRFRGHLFDGCLRPRLDAGELHLYTTRAHRRLTLLRLAWQTLTRNIDAVDGLEEHGVSAATISPLRGGSLPLAIDGEVCDLPPPLRFRIRPRALRVVAPRSVGAPVLGAKPAR